MSNLVTVKRGDFYYRIPMHEFSRYWLPHLGGEMPRPGDMLEVKRLPDEIPYVSKKVGLARGKSFKREIKAYAAKGSGKHATHRY